MELLRTIEGIRSPFLDTVFGLITRFGEEMILIVVFCALYWCINKRAAYVMGVVFFMSSLVVQGMKIIFRVPRPWVVDPTFEPVGGAVRMATGYAFPSGHTQNAAALLGSLGAQTKAWWFRIACFTLAVLVAFSRMYLGVHFLSDVIVSLIVTFAILFVALKIVAREEICVKRELAISGVIVLVGIAVLVYSAVLYHADGVTTYAQLRDATRAAGAAIGFAIGMFVERVYIRFSVKTKNLGFQFVKFAIGIAGTLIFMEGIGAVNRLIHEGWEVNHGIGLAVDVIRYFLVVAWITLLYPLIIKKFFAVAESSD